MLNEFKQYLLGIGKSENTALNYCDKVKLYFKWCLDSFGSEPQQLYRANVLDYISYMKTIKRYSPKSVNNHLSSLRSFNEFLIFSGRQTELAIVKNDFMKIQTQYANPCTVEQKDVEAFRQRLLEGGNKRDFAIVTLYTYTGIRRSECVNLRLDQINLIAKEIYVVGNNEVFELLQSAYSGAPEKMDDTSIKEFSIYSLSSCGRRTPVYTQKRKKAEGVNTTQLDAIVDYVASYCSSKGVARLSNICLPPLEDYLTVPTNLGDYTVESIPLGVYDDPGSQYQGLAHFNLCDDNTMIIGASQIGKTNLIQSIIRLISSKYSPKDAVFYIADFGAMYLKNFETLHHVGGVVTISEGEKFKNLFKLLTEEVQRRKARFLDCGLSSYAAYREAGYTDLPHIFFVIDNFSAFKEVYAEAYEDQFVYLTREGVSCGISILVTNASTNGLGYRYMSNFACRLSFRCNDAGEYMNIFDRCRMQPKDVPGRMLCKLNKELYEMQSFIAFEGEKELDRSNAVKKFVRVGEITGLRWQDVDFEKGSINVNHTLVYYNHRDERGTYFGINTPKTKAGCREIPMISGVKEAFELEREYQRELGIESKSRIDGYENFVFVNQYGNVQHHGTLNRAIKRVIRDCNDRVLLENDLETKPVLLPDFSCHNLRHTFATRLCESGINIKVIQSVLGHVDISTTMDIYVDVMSETKKRELAQFDDYMQQTRQ